MTTPTRDQIVYFIRDVKFAVKTTDEAAAAILALFEQQEDMAAVGRALMEAIEDYKEHDFITNWHPLDCPSEIVGDLLGHIDEQSARVVELEAENKRLVGLRRKISGALEADVEPVVKIKLVREALGEKPPVEKRPGPHRPASPPDHTPYA